MDTLEDTIKRYEIWSEDGRVDEFIRDEHRQFADWLKELKQLREESRWIPVTEKTTRRRFNCTCYEQRWTDRYDRKSKTEYLEKIW